MTLPAHSPLSRTDHKWYKFLIDKSKLTAQHLELRSRLQALFPSVLIDEDDKYLIVETIDPVQLAWLLGNLNIPDYSLVGPNNFLN